MCTSVQQCRYPFGQLSSSPGGTLGQYSFHSKPYLRGKILLTKSLPQGHKFKGDFVVFYKICSQMLNNFTAFSTVFSIIFM